jgi:hypothetical protein
MGMDVYGKNPTSDVGEYYRQSVWGWHPLWHYVELYHEQYANKVQHGHSNDGDGLGAEDSSQLSLSLKQDLITGMAQQRLAEWQRQMDELPLENCDLCNATGIRTDENGVKFGMDKKELSAEQSEKLGRRIGYCNGCEGVGKKQPFIKNYSTSIDDIREFADFLADCGGFEIC